MAFFPAQGPDTKEPNLSYSAMYSYRLVTRRCVGIGKPAKQQGRPQNATNNKSDAVMLSKAVFVSISLAFYCRTQEILHPAARAFLRAFAGPCSVFATRRLFRAARLHHTFA